MYKYRARVGRVVDGDTVYMHVDLGFHMSAYLSMRLIGVDTPERGEEDFDVATAELTSLLESVADEDGYVDIESSKTGKFGRWLVTIKGVNDPLIERWPYE